MCVQQLGDAADNYRIEALNEFIAYDRVDSTYRSVPFVFLKTPSLPPLLLFFFCPSGHPKFLPPRAVFATCLLSVLDQEGGWIFCHRIYRNHVSKFLFVASAFHLVVLLSFFRFEELKAQIKATTERESKLKSVFEELLSR
jgi:hypothetical protein